LVHHHAPGEDELARWVGLDDLTVDGDIGRADVPHRLAGVGDVAGARAEVEIDASAVSVPLGPLGLRDGVPDCLGTRLDVDAVDLRRGDIRLCHGGHSCSSSWDFSSVSAETRRSVY